mgnify:CR=1 FL=1
MVQHATSLTNSDMSQLIRSSLVKRVTARQSAPTNPQRKRLAARDKTAKTKFEGDGRIFKEVIHDVT